MKCRLIIFVAVAISLLSVTSNGQESTKSAVVHIENTKRREVGAGFIVRIDRRQLYVVTAAHVVSGDQHPHVYLFNRQNEPVQATVINKQEDDLKGIALLKIDTDASGVAELPLGATSNLGNSESVTFVGFPGTALWTVDSGNIRRLDGSDLVLSGPAQHGNSGGPVVLNGLAVGLITDVAQPEVYAMRSEIIVTYVNGLVRNLIKLSDTDRADFCATLMTLVDASKGGFYSIVGKATNSSSSFYPNLLFPGANYGYVNPSKRAYYTLIDDKNQGNVESVFYGTVTKARRCLDGWQEKEVSDSSYRYHKFRKEDGGVVVSIYYTHVPQHGNYFATLDFALPSKERSEW